MTRRSAGYRATDQVVAGMDAAVDGECACGCRAAITPSSPSAYYASPECQQTWMARNVDNPGEVYRRADAAAFPLADAAQQDLTEPGTGRRRTFEHVDHVHVDFRQRPPRRNLIYGPGVFVPLFEYQRTCPSCDDFMTPRIYSVGDCDLSRRAWLNMLPIDQWEQECSSCDAAVLGPVHFPAVYPAEEPEGWTLELNTPFGRVRSTVTRRALERTPDGRSAESFIRQTWASMERDLARFEREWRGRLNRTRAAMMACMASEPPQSVVGDTSLS
jgi:hypothetical protein